MLFFPRPLASHNVQVTEKGTNDRNRWQKQFPLFFLTSCGNENTRLSHKSSSKIFSSAKRELDIFMFSVSIRWQSEREAYYQNRKRGANDFEKVYENTRDRTFVIVNLFNLSPTFKLQTSLNLKSQETLQFLEWTKILIDDWKAYYE